MTHVDYRLGLIALLPVLLVFLAGLAAGVAAIFLICNLPLMRRVWDRGQTVSFAVSAALSLSVLVLISSGLSGLILMNGWFGEEAYVPESYPIFLFRPAAEFFVVLLAALVSAMLAFGWFRNSSELLQRLVVPGVFICVFVLALSLTKTWASYWALADQFDADVFFGALYQMARTEFADIGTAFSGFNEAFPADQAGLFGRFFQALGTQIDALWRAVRNAGGNQFVLVEAFPEIFAVSSLAALVYMVLRWPFTAFTHSDDT